MARRKRYKRYYRSIKLFKACWPQVLFKRRSRLPLYLILITITILPLYVKLTQSISGVNNMRSKYTKIVEKTQRLQYQLRMLSFKFSFRDHINAITLREAQNRIANWPGEFIDMANLFAHDHLYNLPVVINVHCSLEHFNLFLASFRQGLAETRGTILCIFAASCRESSRQYEMSVVNMVNDLKDVCLKRIWNVTQAVPEDSLKFGKRHSHMEKLQKPKLTWWYSISTFYQQGIVEGVLFDGILKDFQKDILFIDSNVILAPDFLQAATFASNMKTLAPGITQFSLGAWGGHNLINAHPDSFAVTRTRALHGLVYGMNLSNWKVLSRLQDDFLEDLNPSWSEAVGDAVNMEYGGLGVQTIVPTLSRFWLVPTNTMPRSSFPPWLLSPRPINLTYPSLNVGIRDSLGFLCARSGWLQNSICYCSFWTWEKTTLKDFPRCFPQGNELCLDSY